MDEFIVFLMRSFPGWTLEYTTNLVRTLPARKLNALLKELRFQRAVEDYRQAANFARIVSTLASSKAHRYSIKDIIGPPPQREIREEKLHDIAEKEGIKLPKEG